MGWLRDSAPGHEGYVVGLVEGRSPGGTPFIQRELTAFHGDNEPVGVVRLIQAGCDCGWRSRVYHAPVGTSWHPYTVSLPREEHENALAEVWGRHVDDEAGAARQASVGHRILIPWRSGS